MDIATQIKEKITSLEEALLASNPQMKTILREIHTTLKENPEVVTLLNEDDIHIIVNGLEKQTATELATTIATKKSGSKALKNISLADL